MKTRSFLESQSNIASIVKARRNLVTEAENISFSQFNGETLIAGVPINSNLNIINETVNTSTLPHSLPEKKVIIKTLWSLEDKIMFFTALKSFGKNFNEISRFIKNRCSRLNPKKSGKTKEQVRFFYNRTWNNIKPYLKFPIELLQSVQELYALISYSVFRTRIKKRLNPKLGEKLNEMVMNGSTVIKCNGKRITLRTPVCPALKKINNIKVPEQEYTIPDDVVIEMVPRNYVTLWRVQQIEQNPRMRLKISMNRQLSDVIHFLSNKLKSNSQIIRENLSLPTVDPPKLHIRLSDDSKLFKEVLLQEITKPRFDNITLKSYRDNILKVNVDTAIDKDPERSQASLSNQTSDGESSYLKMDFSEIQRKLSAGVGTEDAREMKILSLYIGLGCPSVIKFMYEYLHPNDVDTAQKSVSNGLRRMLHLGKHDYLEYENNKDTKNKLEQEITEMQKKLNDMKQQLTKMQSDNYREPGTYIDIDEQATTPRQHQGSNQNQRQDVYKKQHEALKQLIEDLPNKSNVVVEQVALEYNSIESVKRFNKTRKNQRSVNKNKAAAVFTLKMPLNTHESHYQDNNNNNNNNNNNMDQSDGQMATSNNFFPSMGSLYHPSTSDDVFLHGHEAQSTSMYNQHIMSINNHHQSAPPLDHGDNTNDSLRSFLNDINDAPRSVEGNHNIDFQNYDHNNSFFNLIHGNGGGGGGGGGTSSAPAAKHEDVIIASMSNDSNSGSITHLLNSYVKPEKRS